MGIFGEFSLKKFTYSFNGNPPIVIDPKKLCIIRTITRKNDEHIVYDTDLYLISLLNKIFNNNTLNKSVSKYAHPTV